MINLRRLGLTILPVFSFVLVFLLTEGIVRWVLPAPLSRGSSNPALNSAKSNPIDSLVKVRKGWRNYNHDYRCDFSGITRKNVHRKGPREQTTIYDFSMSYHGQPLATWSATVDEDFMRWTPGPSGDKADKHLIFWGCSFTFGTAVGDSESLPFFVQQKSPGYRAYNRAREGGSVADAIFDVQKDQLFSFVPQRDGVGVFVVIGSHIPRMAGSYYLLDRYLGDFAYTERGRDGHFHSPGTWRESRPGLIRLVQLLYHSEFFKWLNLDLYARTGQVIPNFIRDYADAIRDLKEMYLRGTRSTNRFVVFLYPNSLDSYTYINGPLRDELVERKIEVIDYSAGTFGEISERPTAMPVDCHPNAEANRIVGGWLAEDLVLGR